MAVYFDHQVQAPEGSYRHELLQWHPKFSLLALASYNELAGGEVNLFFEEVTDISNLYKTKSG